jgi:phosphoenolpyruvate carboxylase
LGSSPSIESIQLFARTLIGDEESQTESSALLSSLREAAAACPDDESRLDVLIARAGLAAHGLALARPHFRLNAAQVHNAARRVVGIEGDPVNPATRRSLLAAINRELDAVEPVPVDFGALAAERASAARLMMTVAQLLKFVDGSNPVRFLIAETETGYTLLAALWLAKRFGVADRVEITPLFETAEALERGVRVLDEALRSSHWRDYLASTGRLVIQFGYSDSGRYIGQLAATFWIERLRLRLVELLESHGLQGIELVLFDTHGESIGRGAHPDSLQDRLAYLAPTRSRAQLAEAGIPVRLESSFQGGDGYLLFGTRELALGTVARIAEHVFHDPRLLPDLIYDQQDFAAEFFATIRQEMEALVAEPGYAALLGTFGPNLVDPTGSRPSTREHDHLGRVKTITHPRQIRAIPNNAILHQLGWSANSFHGVGLAASRAPDLFRQAHAESDRFGRAMRLATRGMAVSDLDVIRAYVDTLDPSVWLDRARRTERPERRNELSAIALALEELALSDPLRRMFRRLTRDWLSVKAVTPETPNMSTRLMLFHALRLALIHRIWFLATAIPDFSPQRGVSREVIVERILRLDVPASLALLREIFPDAPDPTLRMDFGEPQGPRESSGYRREHETLFQPMERLFDLVREISAGISHEVGAFG